MDSLENSPTFSSGIDLKYPPEIIKGNIFNTLLGIPQSIRPKIFHEVLPEIYQGISPPFHPRITSAVLPNNFSGVFSSIIFMASSKVYLRFLQISFKKLPQDIIQRFDFFSEMFIQIYLQHPPSPSILKSLGVLSENPVRAYQGLL